MNPVTSIGLAVDPALRAAMIPTPPVEPRGTGVITRADLDRFDPEGTLGIQRSGGSGKSFENVLGDLVNEVSSRQRAAGNAVNGLLSGENIPLHRVMIATEEASISFQLMVEIRNKLLESYQELMRMQV